MRGIAWVTILALVGSFGCSTSENRLPTYKVTGQLLHNSKPLPNATIVLHPVSPSGADAVKPRGRTDANGQFSLTTYDHEDGAPAGEYLVTVEQWLTTNPEEGPKNRLPAKFSKPDTAKLPVKINSEPTNNLKLELPK